MACRGSSALEAEAARLRLCSTSITGANAVSCTIHPLSCASRERLDPGVAGAALVLGGRWQVERWR